MVREKNVRYFDLSFSVDLLFLCSIYLFWNEDRELREVEHRQFLLRAASTDRYIHWCNYVSRTKLINCDNVSLIQPTNVETCCNIPGLQLITFAISTISSLSSFFLFFIPRINLCYHCEFNSYRYMRIFRYLLKTFFIRIIILWFVQIRVIWKIFWAIILLQLASQNQFTARVARLIGDWH